MREECARNIAHVCICRHDCLLYLFVCLCLCLCAHVCARMYFQVIIPTSVGNFAKDASKYLSQEHFLSCTDNTNLEMGSRTKVK